MYNPVQQYRHSNRLKGYDYTLAGAYFVTIVTYQHLCLFGEVIKGEVKLNSYGMIAIEQWKRLEKRFPLSDISTFVIMPNHIHGIIYLTQGAGEDNQ
jgi:REP element-mobilizing transposase RayT